jgi:hypothetical protein
MNKALKSLIMSAAFLGLTSAAFAGTCPPQSDKGGTFKAAYTYLSSSGVDCTYTDGTTKTITPRISLPTGPSWAMEYFKDSDGNVIDTAYSCSASVDNCQF